MNGKGCQRDFPAVELLILWCVGREGWFSVGAVRQRGIMVGDARDHSPFDNLCNQRAFFTIPNINFRPRGITQRLTPSVHSLKRLF